MAEIFVSWLQGRLAVVIKYTAFIEKAQKSLTMT